MTFVYVDTETTGLDPNRHQVWELAYAIDDGPVVAAVVAHSLEFAVLEALEVGGYNARGRGRAMRYEVEEQARSALRDVTLVGANPAFDAAFLRTRWGVAPWRYRLLDVEAYAMPALGYDVPHGLRDVVRDLRDIHRVEVPVPDHTAAGDVATTRACHRALQAIYAGWANRLVGAS